MGSKIDSICKTLADSVTSLLLVDNKETTIASQLEKAIHKKNFSNIQIDVIESNSSIPNHDVYLLNIHRMSDSSLTKLVRDIYAANSKAALFVIGDEDPDIIHKIEDSVRYILDDTKLGKAVQGFVNPKNLDFSPVIQYIRGVENTKKRLTKMWSKIEAANQNLAKIKESD